MGQQRLAKPAGDDLSKRPQIRHKTGNSVLDHTKARRGEALRAQRRASENVAARASQHIVDIPVNKSIYNGYGGKQYSLATQRRKKPDNRPKLRVIPIGGVGEMGIGKNMTALEYDNEIIIIDMGFLFPGDDYPGVNYIVPDISYLEERKENIRAIIFTHGHLDHIGAFRHLIAKIPAPVYATKFTIGMLKKNMEESSDDFEPEYHELVPEKHERAQVGDYFNIELVRVNHSIPDSTAVAVRTPVGVVISSGDWRFEKDPIDGRKFDLTRMTEIASKEGILLLMNESTNCEQQGAVSYGEKDVKVSFGQVMDKYTESRVIVSTFSSQIHRIQSIVEQAAAHNRKIAVAGFSMVQTTEIALKSGDLKIPAGVVMKMEDIVKLPDKEVCIICTGSQGEFNAVLKRMATGAHRWVKIKDSDVIVFSSSAIPGNETYIVSTVDGLMREGSDVLRDRHTEQYGIGRLHLSGHGYYDDHVKFITALNPKFYLPNHGEFHMLVHNAELAENSAGIPRDHIFVCDAGDVVEFYHDGTAKKNGRVHSGGIMYDDSGAVVSEVVLKDRLMMSTEGIFTVVLTVQKGSGRLLSSPDIISRGFIYLRDSEELINLVRQYLKQKIAKAYAGRRVDLETLKKEIRDDVGQILYDQTHRTPIVIPVINEIGRSQTPPRRDQPVISPRLMQQMGTAPARSNFARPTQTQAPRPAKPLIKDPSQISFKRRPQGESAGGLWRKPEWRGSHTGLNSDDRSV
ncbi:MAG: ribonuclease J [Candidatus Nomurabacteria bacterium]|jgi:ribonuclease J|nr:ribonuclease J [Candidatus Nomurabacteria bacterium]